LTARWPGNPLAIRLAAWLRLAHLRKSDLALAALGAACMALAAPRTNLWPLGLVVWVPLAFVAASGDALRAALVGWIQGALAQGAVLASLPAALHEGGGTSPFLSWGLALFLASLEGARFGVIGLAAARAARNGWPIVLAFPLTLAAIEWLYPMFFPWSTWLFFQSAPVLLQGAELGGALVLSLWAGFLDASLATAWREQARRPLLLRYGVFVPAATLAAVVLGGMLRMRVIDRRSMAAPELRIGLIQGNISKVRQESRDPALLYRSAALELLSERRIDLLIWPETAIFFPVRFEGLSRFLSDRLFHDALQANDTARIDVPLLSGMVLDRTPPESAAHVHMVNPDGTWQEAKAQRFNSAVLATPDGVVRGVYDKRDLVTFGEYIPRETSFPWLRRLLPSAGTFSPGTSSAPLTLWGKRILVLICYEDIMAERVRDAVDEGDPDLLVNLTSDAWFGRSRVPSLHLALARLRAVEHRRFLVHATNTGVSAVFDPAGRIVADLPPQRPASAATTVRWMRSRTAYEALGRGPSFVVAGMALLFSVRRRLRAIHTTTPR
jgi:apolipoprotein N-acyltransferase